MNVNAIYEAIEEYSRKMLLADMAQKKRNQINEVESKRCGNCHNWMKSSCLPEKQHKQFKSAKSFGCAGFSQCNNSARLAEKFRAELDEINQRREGE